MTREEVIRDSIFESAKDKRAESAKLRDKLKIKLDKAEEEYNNAFQDLEKFRLKLEKIRSEYDKANIGSKGIMGKIGTSLGNALTYKPYSNKREEEMYTKGYIQGLATGNAMGHNSARVIYGNAYKQAAMRQREL